MSEKHLKTGDANPPVNPDVIRLYSMRYCPYVKRVEYVLETKGLEYERVNCNLKEKPEFLLERNPAGSVPVLEYKGHVIRESVTIAELLDDLFPDRPIATSEPFQKAKDKILIAKVGQEVATPFYTYHRNLENLEAKEKLERGLVSFCDELKSRKTTYFGGEQPGMVDLMTYPILERVLAMAPTRLDTLPDLKAWCGRMEALSVIKKCRPDDLKEFYTEYFIDKTKVVYK